MSTGRGGGVINEYREGGPLKMRGGGGGLKNEYRGGGGIINE